MKIPDSNISRYRDSKPICWKNHCKDHAETQRNLGDSAYWQTEKKACWDMVSSLSNDAGFKLSSSHSHRHVWHKQVPSSQAVQTPSRINFILLARKSGGCLWCKCAFMEILTWWSPLFYTLMLKPSHFSTEGRYLIVFTYLVCMCVKVLHAFVCRVWRPISGVMLSYSSSCFWDRNAYWT